jgi:hypothetical protein
MIIDWIILTADEALNLLAQFMALLVVPHLDHSLHNDRKLDNLNSEAVVPNLYQSLHNATKLDYLNSGAVVPHLDHSLHNDTKLDYLNSR